MTFWGILISLVDPNTITYDNPTVESHAFITADSSKEIIYTMLMASPPQTGSLSSIKINDPSMGNVADIKAHYFSPSGHVIIPPRITEDGNAYILDLNTFVTLHSGKAVLITCLERQ